jgi:hypothetical protein
MKIKKNAMSTLVLEFFLPIQIQLSEIKNPKIYSPYRKYGSSGEKYAIAVNVDPVYQITAQKRTFF